MQDREVEYVFDDPEVISLCLNCYREECDNCLGTNASPKNLNEVIIDHDKFMTLYNNWLTDGQIGKEFGVSAEFIRHYRKRRGIPTKRPKNALDKNKLIALYEQGLSDGQIAAELGMTTAYICSCRNRLGLPTKHPVKRRSKNAERIR